MSTLILRGYILTLLHQQRPHFACSFRWTWNMGDALHIFYEKRIVKITYTFAHSEILVYYRIHFEEGSWNMGPSIILYPILPFGIWSRYKKDLRLNRKNVILCAFLLILKCNFSVISFFPLLELSIYLAHQLKNLLQMLHPLSWQQECSVLYAKLILRPIIFSESLVRCSFCLSLHALTKIWKLGIMTSSRRMQVLIFGWFHVYYFYG